MDRTTGKEAALSRRLRAREARDKSATNKSMNKKIDAEAKKLAAEAKKMELEAKGKLSKDRKEVTLRKISEKNKTARITALAGAGATSLNNATNALKDWNAIATGTNDGAGKTQNPEDDGTTKGKYNPYTGQYE